MNTSNLVEWDSMMLEIAADYRLRVERPEKQRTEPLAFPLRGGKGEIYRHGEHTLACMMLTGKPNLTLQGLQKVCPAAVMLIEGEGEAIYTVDTHDASAVEAFLGYFGVKRKKVVTDALRERLAGMGNRFAKRKKSNDGVAKNG